MSVKDRGTPSQTGNNAFVTITITRNKSPPSFAIASYEKTISENFTVGGSVERVTATDSDGTVNIEIFLAGKAL